MRNTPLFSLPEEEKVFAPPTKTIPIKANIVPMICGFLIFLLTRSNVKIKVEIILPPLNIWYADVGTKFKEIISMVEDSKSNIAGIMRYNLFIPMIFPYFIAYFSSSSNFYLFILFQM